jgi:DNA-binding NarL/FixJ family response regulator
MKRKTRIMLVEDHPEFREIVAFALNKESDIKVIAQFGTAERALRCLKHGEVHEVPDIIILDLHLPGMSGLQAIPLLSVEMPDARIIVLSQSDRDEDVLQAIMLGASGYLLKSSTVAQIAEGVRIVMQGGASLDTKLAMLVLKTLKTNLPASQVVQVLTHRELEVLTMLADGRVKKEIADTLQISVSTVVTHVGHIYEKLNAPNAPAAIAKAFKLGILPAAPFNS